MTEIKKQEPQKSIFIPNFKFKKMTLLKILISVNANDFIYANTIKFNRCTTIVHLNKWKIFKTLYNKQ